MYIARQDEISGVLGIYRSSNAPSEIVAFRSDVAAALNPYANRASPRDGLPSDGLH